MLADMMGIVGSAGAGAVMGLIGNIISAGVEKKKLALAAEKEKTQQMADAINQNSTGYKVDKGGQIETVSYLWGLYYREGITRARAISPPFKLCLTLITATYCAATLVCFLLGDIVIATQNPTGEPIVTSWLWGLYSSSHVDSTVSVVTFASVGYGMACFLNFIMAAVFTGIVPKRHQ